MRRALIAFAVVTVAACSTPRGGGYYEDDGPHARPRRDIESVPDAVPRVEPLSRGGNRPYTVFNVRYTPLPTAVGYRERGIASWYGKKFDGKKTSNGEVYDMYVMSAAHKTLPLPSYVRVRNLRNGRSVIVRVNDRGPFLHNRLIDLSYAAAARLGIVGSGTGLVEVEGIDAAQPLTAQAPRARPEDTRLYVQLGAFAERDNAERLHARLRRAGFNPALMPNDAGPTLYRVRCGPLESVEESDRLIADLRARGFADVSIAID